MYESTFKNCYMEGADFSCARFGQVSFINTDLTKADFENATLSELGFHNVNLSYANLRGAKKIDEVTFKDVIFHKTIMPDGSIRTDRDELEI